MQKIVMMRCFWMILCISMVQSSHFYGGTLTWKPLNNSILNSNISVMFTQSYQWRQLQVNCDQNYIDNQTPKIPMNADLLRCVSSSCGDYIPLSVNGYCTDFSTILDSSSSQIYNVETFTNGSKFCVAYRNAAWPGHQSPSCNYTCYVDTAKWSIGYCIDLEARTDQFLNTPPVATIVSPIRVPTNSSFEINIPVIDADGDEIRCRWAQNRSDFDECGDICGELPDSSLEADNCTLIFNTTGKRPGDFYAVALMVEDFSNESNETALSAIPVQFLIQIIAKPVCPLKPTVTSNGPTSFTLLAGESINFTMIIRTDCVGRTIVEFFRTAPLNMRKSNITYDVMNNQYTVTESWTPTSDQIGSQAYCATGVDSASIQSDLFCVTFLVRSPIRNTTDNEEENGSGDTTEPQTTEYESTISTVLITTETETTTTDTTRTTTTSTSSTTDTTTTTTDTTVTTTTSTSTTSRTTTTTTTTTTSKTTSTTTTSVTTTTTSTTSTSTSTTTSTSSTSTSTSSTTSTTSTTSTSSTTSTTSTTTTTAQESVTVTVHIPVSTRDNSGFIGLGLGLGIPLLGAFIGLGLARYCQEPCSSISNRFRSDATRQVETAEDTEGVLSNERLADSNKDQNESTAIEMADYREEYIRREPDPHDDEHQLEPNQSTFENEERPIVPPENSFACVSISDFELQTTNVTTTSLISPSTNSLPTFDVQHTRETKTKTMHTPPTGSVLVRAYSQQQRNKSAAP